VSVCEFVIASVYSGIQYIRFTNGCRCDRLCIYEHMGMWEGTYLVDSSFILNFGIIEIALDSADVNKF